MADKPPAADGPFDDRLLPTPEIVRAIGQTVAEALDLTSWERHGGLEQMLGRIGQFVDTTVQADQRMHGILRSQVLSRLHQFTDAPAEAGLYRIEPRHLRAALHNHLIPGRVTAAHGAGTGHDTLSASIISIGVCLVRYDGEQRSWRTTFLRHDYDVAGDDPTEEVRRFLDRKHGQESTGGVSRDRLSYLLRRGFLAAAERKALLEKAPAGWRMGRGMPAPLELLTGAGSTALLDHVLPILDQLLLQQTRWVFVPTSSNAALTAMAAGLDAGELAILMKYKATLQDVLERGHFEQGYRKRVLDIAERLGERVVVGAFKATTHSPAQLFLAPAETALLAGIVAMADAQLQPHRVVPLLLDLAGESVKAGIGIEAFSGVVELAYARAGVGGLLVREPVLSESA